MAGIRRDTADKYFSDCVRERANWCCENCGTYYPEGNRRGIECAHIVGRANKRLRWEPLNAIALCTGCHMKYTANPLQFTQFVISKIGKQGHDILIELSRELIRATKQLKKEVGVHYKQEYKKMAEKRSEGEIGRIEFMGFL